MTRSASGRPLRFYAILLTGWIAIRFVGPDITTPLPSPIAPAPSSSAVLAPVALLDASAMPTIRPATHIGPMTHHDDVPRSPLMKTADTAIPRSGRNEGIAPQLTSSVGATTDLINTHGNGSANDSGIHAPALSPLPQSAHPTHANRWRASAWLLWRPGGSTASKTIPAGQLGGSQAGLRLDYDIAPNAASRMTAYGRITSALKRPTAPEAAIGLSIQPVRTVPITFAAERRIALDDSARNANSIMAVGGFGPQPIAPSLLAEAYAQTGIVGFRQRDAFIDGKFSLTSPLPRTPIRIGAAVSGGVQPGVSRLDIGPELQVRLALPQTNARLSVEWRERIAGNANPGSGLAITLAGDF
jgi:hypothetical protein